MGLPLPVPAHHLPMWLHVPLDQRGVVKGSGTQTTKRAYYKKGATHKFVKRLLALPFLPADQIPTAFWAFWVNNAPLQPLIQYVSTTWMDNQQWPLAAWSVFGLAVLTNNNLEGWHTWFNSITKCKVLPQPVPPH